MSSTRLHDSPLAEAALAGHSTSAWRYGTRRLGAPQQTSIQVKLEHSFTEPLQLSGKVKGELNMPRAVQIEPTRSLAVKVVEHAPINLSMTNRTPVEVQVRNAQPIQVQVDESKPIQVDMDPQAPVKVKVGF